MIESLALRVPHQRGSLFKHSPMLRCSQARTASYKGNDTGPEVKLVDTSCQPLAVEATAPSEWLWCLPTAAMSVTKAKHDAPAKFEDDNHTHHVKCTKRILTKYIASLVSMCMGLYVQHPITATSLLRRFQPFVWALFLRCTNRHVIKAIIDSFETIDRHWDRGLTERVLARALRASAQTDNHLHAKV